MPVLYNNLNYTFQFFDLYCRPVFSVKTKVKTPLQIKIPYKKEIVSNDNKVKNYENFINQLIKGLDSELEQKINCIKKVEPDFKIIANKETLWKNIRGGRFEELINMMFCILKEEGKLTDIKWDVTYKKYGIPWHAPGGRSDILITLLCNSTKFLIPVEVTLIGPTVSQFKNEAASVIYHKDKLIKTTKDEKTIIFGYFIAPEIDKTNMKLLVQNDILPVNVMEFFTDYDYIRKLGCEHIKNFPQKIKRFKDIYENQ